MTCPRSQNKEVPGTGSEPGSVYTAAHQVRTRRAPSLNERAQGALEHSHEGHVLGIQHLTKPTRSGPLGRLREGMDK